MSEFPKMLYTEGKMITVEGEGLDYIIVDNADDAKDALEMRYRETPEKPVKKQTAEKKPATKAKAD